MSTKCSLAYVKYSKGEGTLHIFFDMMDCRYYIESDEGKVELSESIAKQFAAILEKEYKDALDKPVPHD